MKPLACPFPRNARVLFQGDSITDGNRGRNEDPNHILGHGYAFLIASRFGAQFPERNLTFLNRGISGNTIADLDARWKPQTLDLQPDMLSILIGINDVATNLPVDRYGTLYEKLLRDTRAALPTVRFVLCEPFTLPVGRVRERWDTWRADVGARQEIVAGMASRYKAPVVKLQKVFDDACRRGPAEYWIWDGIHPTYSGHYLIAEAWVEAVSRFYPASGE